MKKLLILITACCIFSLLSMNAQISQGKILIGMSSSVSILGTGSNLLSIGFSSIKYKSDASGYEEPEPDKLTQIVLLPRAGYMITDNLALGLDLDIALYKTEDGESGSTSQWTIMSVGPFARLYFPMEKVNLFLEAGGTIGSLNSKYNSDSYDSESKMSIISYGGGIGMVVPLGEKVTFDVLAGYNSYISKDKDDNEDNERDITGTIGIKFGFLVFLGS
ncbi:MAG TPA: outer membrane beta-barrel protein [Bacteroidales bacterium]|nr:outer membrane beta-barrel protein [Bacteroidales bacterium]